MAARLNRLSGKAWIKSTKSVWMNGVPRASIANVKDAMASGVLLSEAPPRDDLKKQHPATFSEKDVAKLIRFFTKPGEVVLDPFMGTGSTGIACLETGRRFIGIELYAQWLSIARRRIGQRRRALGTKSEVSLIKGDALREAQQLESASVHFIVTSPPYWSILGKLDHKAKRERLAHALPTNYGRSKHDLATAEGYDEFLSLLGGHFAEYYRLLKPRKYAALIVSDFRHKQKYFLFHAHVAEGLERAGFVVQGLINLVQDNKRLYPYGYPTTYVPNISNQFIVLARKL